MTRIPPGYTLLEPSPRLRLVVRQELAAGLGGAGLDRFPEPEDLQPLAVLRALVGRGPAPSGRAPVGILDAPGIGRLVVKRYRRGGLFGRLLGGLYLGGGRPLREMAITGKAAVAGVPVVPMEVLWQEHRGPFFTRQAAASREVPGARDLFAFLVAGPPEADLQPERRAAISLDGDPPSSPAPPAGSRASVLRKAAAAVRALHDAGIAHGDLSLGNLLVAPAGAQPAGESRLEVLLIDFDRAASTGRPLGLRRRAAALARMKRSLVKRSWPGPPPLLPAEERHFLDAYASSGSGGDSAALLAATCRRCRRELTFHRIWWRVARSCGLTHLAPPDSRSQG